MPTTGVKLSADSTPYLEIDDFWDLLPTLAAAGWVFTNISRYDPTHLDGLTPSGKAFSADLIGGVVSMTIAGNTRTANVAKSAWLTGAATVTAIDNVRAAFPAAQR